MMEKDSMSETEPREYLICKNGYFYRPNRAGYTMEKAAAGRYTKAEAEREARIEPHNFTVLHESEVPDAPGVVDLKAAHSDLMREVREVLNAAPRPSVAVDDPEALSAFVVSYMDWYFQSRGALLSKLGEA